MFTTTLYEICFSFVGLLLRAQYRRDSHSVRCFPTTGLGFFIFLMSFFHLILKGLILVTLVEIFRDCLNFNC